MSKQRAEMAAKHTWRHYYLKQALWSYSPLDDSLLTGFKGSKEFQKDLAKNQKEEKEETLTYTI